MALKFHLCMDSTARTPMSLRAGSFDMVKSAAGQSHRCSTICLRVLTKSWARMSLFTTTPETHVKKLLAFVRFVTLRWTQEKVFCVVFVTI